MCKWCLVFSQGKKLKKARVKIKKEIISLDGYDPLFDDEINRAVITKPPFFYEYMLKLCGRYGIIEDKVKTHDYTAYGIRFEDEELFYFRDNWLDLNEVDENKNYSLFD